MRTYLLTAIVVGLSLGLLVSCAHKMIQEPDRVAMDESKAQLLERAQLFWKALYENDIETQVAMRSPRHRSLQLNLKGGQSQSFNFVNYKIDAIEMDADANGATVVITYSFIMPPVPRPKVVVGQPTRWELIEGVWYPEYKEEEDSSHISGARR
ncbi:hypothetical protein JW905_17400 [bacterium]|nr:hypothetical protein [candidate division CSSED10-310 bacterium]